MQCHTEFQKSRIAKQESSELTFTDRICINSFIFFNFHRILYVAMTLFMIVYVFIFVAIKTPENLRSLFGIFLFPVLLFLYSNNKRNVSNFLLQFAFLSKHFFTLINANKRYYWAYFRKDSSMKLLCLVIRVFLFKSILSCQYFCWLSLYASIRTFLSLKRT